MRVILDTNVLFSGLGSHGKASPPVLLVAQVLRASTRLVLSNALFQEYVGVLGRPSFQRWSGLDNEAVRRVLDALAAGALWHVPPRSQLVCPDEDDQHLWDLLAIEPEASLITGERVLLESGDFPGHVLRPREALALLG